MPKTVTINLPRLSSRLAASAFSFSVAAATVLGRPGLTTGLNRSLRSLGRAKARPLANRYTTRVRGRLKAVYTSHPVSDMTYTKSWRLPNIPLRFFLLA